MGNKNKLSSYDYFLAMQVASDSSYVYSYENIPDVSNAQEELEKQEKYEGLSGEARTIIDMIISSPAEILDLIITPTTGKISREAKKKLFTFFRKQWGWKTKTIFREIEQWTNQL